MSTDEGGHDADLGAGPAQAGVPVATVKYYLREGLLHEGELTSATQARTTRATWPGCG